MFSGIVQGCFPIVGMTTHDKFRTLTLELPEELLNGLEIGASIAVNGVCLTVTAYEGQRVHFDVIYPTLERTNLKRVDLGNLLNIERSLKEGAEIGGHPVSGHVDAEGVIQAYDRLGQNNRVQIQLAERWLRYVFSHGFIAVNGVSLTVSDLDRDNQWFDVWLIPETLRRTNLRDLTIGSCVNVEIHRGTQVAVDAIERAVHQFLEKRLAGHSISKGLIDSLVNLPLVVEVTEKIDSDKEN